MIQQPAVPASTVTYTNPCGQTAFVTVAGGTVTHITVNGTDQATSTNFMATVPAGGTIAITYSAAPTWYWSTFTPAIPTSGVPLLNPTGQDISVILLAGTVTHVNVNGTDRATSSPANVMLPNGESITLTYSVAPVWAWMNFIDLANSDSLGTAYASGNTIAPSVSTGVAGYSEANSLPYATHGATGSPGYGAGVSN
jgi:hypothetical protein